MSRISYENRKQTNGDIRRAHVPPLVRKSTSSPCTAFPRMACAPARGGESPSGTCGRLLRERNRMSQGDNSASPEMSEETERMPARIYTAGAEEAPIPRVGLGRASWHQRDQALTRPKGTYVLRIVVYHIDTGCKSDIVATHSTPFTTLCHYLQKPSRSL